MRRRHREIAGGEVAMMAVITKAMGAFLVLMIILLPYYTGDTQGQQTVDETRQKIDEAKRGLEGGIDRLNKGRLSDTEIVEFQKRLALARDELTEAQSLIAQLRIKVDQAASQINRLEQQNAALLSQAASLQSQIYLLQTERDALAQEIAKLRAINTAALQDRIRILEAETAKISPLLNQVAAQQKEIERLERENEVMRTLGAFPTLYLTSKCDRPNMIADLAENPIGIAGFKPIDQFIPQVMPWAGSSPNVNSTRMITGDSNSSSTTNVSLSFEEGKEYHYDFFIRLIYSGAPSQSDAFYAQIDRESPKNAAGDIVSSKAHPSCNVTMFLNWHGHFEPVGVYRLGPVEPVVHVKRISFLSNQTITYPSEDRPKIEQQIADQTCARYSSFCALATQHARMRAQGRNPWELEDLVSSSGGPPPRPVPNTTPSRSDAGTRPGPLERQSIPERDPVDQTQGQKPPPPPQRPAPADINSAPK